MINKRLPRTLAPCLLALALAFGMGSCGSGDNSASSDSPCSLSCKAQSTQRADVPSISLSCGAQPVTCQNAYDDFARIISMTCSYSNGRSVACTGITYNDLGQMTGGTCAGEGQTCHLP